MQVSTPYTTVGDEYCPTSSWSFAVVGTNNALATEGLY